MKDLSLLTWNEIKEIDKSKSVVFVVLAPIGFLPGLGRVNRKKVAK